MLNRVSFLGAELQSAKSFAVIPERAKREPQMRNGASGNLEVPASMLRIAPE
jgi:hypothetical protein